MERSRARRSDWVWKCRCRCRHRHGCRRAIEERCVVFSVNSGCRRVGAKISDAVSSGLGDLGEYASDELEYVESLSFRVREQDVPSVVCVVFRLVEKRFRTGCPVNALEADRASKQIPAKPFEALVSWGQTVGEVSTEKPLFRKERSRAIRSSLRSPLLSSNRNIL